MELLCRAVAAGFRDGDAIRREAVFDPLRARPDFGLIMMDLAMPGDPFGL